MSKIRESHMSIERKRPSTDVWEFQDKVGQYEIRATEFVKEDRLAWLVEVGGQTYWAENGTISLAKFQVPRLEKFADQVDINLQGCISETLARFEKLAMMRK
jgi:hypothetical protein